MAYAYYLQILTIFGINAILALGLNLVTGVAGQLSLGHAAFMSLGAYGSALMTLKAGAPLWLSLLSGALVATFFGLLIGFPTLRLNGDYLAIATLGFGEITRVILLNLPVTGGALGLAGIPHLTTLPIVLAVLGLVVFGMVRLERSRIGRAWLAIREDETAAEAMGIGVTSYKVLAFAVGAFLAGLGGGLYAHMLTYLNPSDFGFLKSIEVLNMVVLGGMGSIPGTLVGSAVLTLAPELLRFMRNYRMLIYGALLVFMMIFRPDGIWSRRRYSPRRRLQRLPAAETVAAESDLAATAEPAEVALQANASRPSRSETEALLQLREVTVAFGGLVAVAGVSLEVRRGEIVGLIGPNGAGKTTIFNLIDGLYRPTAGRIVFAGRDTAGFSPSRLARIGVARTFQNIRLFGNLSVLDNVLVGCHTRTKAGLLGALCRFPWTRREESRATEAALRLLKKVGLYNRADEPASSLAYGEQRRLEIARALAANPGLLLLDEPAAGMNPQETRELMDLIRRIRQEGTTIFLVEHDMHLVTGICDRVVVLDYGAKIAEGPPAQVIADPAVIAAYLG